MYVTLLSGSVGGDSNARRNESNNDDDTTDAVEDSLYADGDAIGIGDAAFCPWDPDGEMGVSAALEGLNFEDGSGIICRFFLKNEKKRSYQFLWQHKWRHDVARQQR